MKQQFSGICDWCRQQSNDLVEHQDFEEGAGKGSARRKGANDKAYADNYDAIFKKEEPHCPKCYSLGVDFEWEEARDMWPEWQTQVAAYEEARKVDDADCIRVEVRAHTGAF